MKNTIINILIIFIIILLAIWHYCHRKEWIEYNKSINTDVKTINQIRKLLLELDTIFTKNKLNYWIQGGTLLGAVRHKDVIPWDVDGDVMIFKNDEQKLLKLKNEFLKKNIIMFPFEYGYRIEFNTKNSPHIDIFYASECNGKISYSHWCARYLWPNQYWEKNELLPLKRYKFNNFYLNGPNNTYPMINRFFGKNWNKVGVKSPFYGDNFSKLKLEPFYYFKLK